MDMIPYIIFKFSNGDDVMAELIAETPQVMEVRNAILMKKMFVTNERGVKTQKVLSMAYSALAQDGIIIVPKYSCNWLGVLRHDMREHYEMLVNRYIHQKLPPVESDEEDLSAVEVPKDKEKIH